MLVKWRDRRDVNKIAKNDEGLAVVQQVRRNNMQCDSMLCEEVQLPDGRCRQDGYERLDV